MLSLGVSYCEKSKLCQWDFFLLFFFAFRVLSFSGQDFWKKQHSSHGHVRSVGLGAAQTPFPLPASAYRRAPASCGPVS